MSDTTSTPGDEILFRSAVKGSISGFDTIQQLDGTTVEQENRSVQQLEKELVDLNANYRIEDIKKAWMSLGRHVRDFNNPHKDSVATLTDGDINKFLGLFLPGASPGTFPAVSIIPAYVALSTSFETVSVARQSEIYLLDGFGFLRGYGANVLAADWVNGKARLPCFGNINQLYTSPASFDQAQVTLKHLKQQSNTFQSGTTRKYPQLYVGGGSLNVSSFLYTLLTETDSTNTSRSMVINPVYSSNPTSSHYTSSFYFYPIASNGTILVTVGNDVFGVDLVTSKAVLLPQSSTSLLRVEKLANGYTRVAVTSTSLPSTLTLTLTRTVIQEGSTYGATGTYTSATLSNVTTYIGYSGDLAVVTGINVTDTSVVAPFIPSRNLMSSQYSMRVSGIVDDFDVATIVARILAPANPKASPNTLMTIGKTSLSYTALSGVAFQATDSSGTSHQITSPPNTGFMTGDATIVASYSNTIMSVRYDNNHLSLTNGVSGAGAITSTSTITINAFDGYLYELDVYPMVTTDNNVADFLIGKASLS